MVRRRTSQYCQPIANPKSSPKNLVAYLVKLPETGRTTAISPRHCIMILNTIAIRTYPVTSARGPPVCSALPEPRKRPVPMLEAIAIIWDVLREEGLVCMREGRPERDAL